jgi:protein disulfide-isomerase A6
MIKVTLFLLCSWALCAHALYSSSSDVVSLSTSNFDRLVKESDSVWVVEFYAPWCGHCKSFATEYSKAATALKGTFFSWKEKIKAM